MTGAGRPRYQQIAADLRAQISDGTYPIGAALPSTSALMNRYDVSITVARAAIKELQNEGVAQGQPGKGVFVVGTPAPIEPSPEFTAIAAQIEGLRETLSQSVQALDDRLTKLEKSVRGRSRRNDG